MPNRVRFALACCAVCLLAGLQSAAAQPQVHAQQNPDQLWENRAKLLPPIAERLEAAAEAEAAGGNLEEAERIFRNALSTREQIDGPNHIDVTITLGKLSVFYWRQARYSEAEEAVARKLSILERHLGPDHIRLTDELDSLALVLLAQGRAHAAGPLLQRALDIRRSVPDANPLAVAESYERLGNQRRAVEALGEAEAFYQKALSAREAALGADHLDVIRTVNSLALVYDAQARYAEAQPLYERTLAAIENTSGANSPDYGAVLNNLAVLNLRLGHDEEATTQLQRSIAIREAHLGGNHPQIAEGLTTLALAYQRLNRMTDARDAAARASFIQSERARLGHMDRPEIRAARHVHLRLLDILLDGVGNAPDADVVFRAGQAAHSSVAAGAVARLAERYALGGGSNARWVRIRQDAQDEFAEIDARLTALAGQSGAARDPAEMERLVAARDDARLTIDATHEMLKAIVGADYQDRIRPGQLSVEEAQGLLGPGEAILAMTVAEKRGTDGADAVFLVAITPQGARTARAEIPDLSGKIGALRRKLSPATVGGRPGLLRFPVDTAHELYRALFEPFSSLLAETQHLLVVPDGAFASLPLGVLLTAPVSGPVTDVTQFAGMPWLIRDFAITTLPSAGALRALRLARERATPGAHPFTGIGDPVLKNHPGTGGQTRSTSIADWLAEAGNDGGTSIPEGLFRGSLADTRAERELASLPETADELATMARLLAAEPGALLLRERASEADIRRERALADHRVIAFATHGLVAGELRGNVAEPALVLTPPETGSVLDDGLLTASEVARMRLNAQWVILSACNTAAPDGTPGADGLSGLTSAFFYAGAQSVFVSHWPVVSNATVKLTTGMLSALSADPGLRASEAHRQSMLALMNDPDEPMFAHPLFWAPFVVVGDGGTLR